MTRLLFSGRIGKWFQMTFGDCPTFLSHYCKVDFDVHGSVISDGGSEDSDVAALPYKSSAAPTQSYWILIVIVACWLL